MASTVGSQLRQVYYILPARKDLSSFTYTQAIGLPTRQAPVYTLYDESFDSRGWHVDGASTYPRRPYAAYSSKSKIWRKVNYLGVTWLEGFVTVSIAGKTGSDSTQLGV